MSTSSPLGPRPGGRTGGWRSRTPRMRLHAKGAGERAWTPRDPLWRLGRTVLRVAVGVVLVRGLVGVLATEPRIASSRVVRLPSDWPDERARTFADEFATSNLTLDPRAQAG